MSYLALKMCHRNTPGGSTAASPAFHYRGPVHGLARRRSRRRCRRAPRGLGDPAVAPSVRRRQRGILEVQLLHDARAVRAVVPWTVVGRKAGDKDQVSGRAWFARKAAREFADVLYAFRLDSVAPLSLCRPPPVLSTSSTSQRSQVEMFL